MTGPEYRESLDVRQSVGYVYRCRDAEGTIIYVGETKRHPLIRFYDHLMRRKAGWAGDVATIEWATLSDQIARFAEETRQIHEHHPVNNRVCPACNGRNEEISCPAEPVVLTAHDLAVLDEVRAAIDDDGLDSSRTDPRAA